MQVEIGSIIDLLRDERSEELAQRSHDELCGGGFSELHPDDQEPWISQASVLLECLRVDLANNVIDQVEAQVEA